MSVVCRVVVVLMMVVMTACSDLSCNCPGAHLPLEQRGCSPPSGCRGGQVMDPCYCCLTCAKVVGETCGGVKGEEGRCDIGLYCHPRQSQEAEPDTAPHGVCTGVPTTPSRGYGGSGYYRNPYTLYPSLQTTSYYNNRQPVWGGYPAGSVSTTQRYPGHNYQPGVQPSSHGTMTQRYPAYPVQNYQPGVQPSPYGTMTQRYPAYPGQNYQPGVQPSAYGTMTQRYPAYPGQNYQPGVQPSAHGVITQRYPAYPGQLSPTTERYPAYPGQNYQPGGQLSPTTERSPAAYPGQNNQPGGQLSPTTERYPAAYPGQNNQPGVQGVTTARSIENSEVSPESTYNWQSFYPQGQQTTTRYPRQTWK